MANSVYILCWQKSESGKEARKICAFTLSAFCAYMEFPPVASIARMIKFAVATTYTFYYNMDESPLPQPRVPDVR